MSEEEKLALRAKEDEQIKAQIEEDTTQFVVTGWVVFDSGAIAPIQTLPCEGHKSFDEAHTCAVALQEKLDRRRGLKGIRVVILRQSVTVAEIV